MSLTSPYSEVYLAGDGVTTVFAYGTDFTEVSPNYVKCIVYLADGTPIVPTYIVDTSTHSITISALTLPDTTVLTAPPIDSIVRIYRDVPEAQNVTASQIQAYTGKQLETAFDAIVAMIQENTYTTEHKTVRLTEPQRDIFLQKLSQAQDGCMLYWDDTNSKLVVTEYPQSNVVLCAGGLTFKIAVNPDTHDPYLQWSDDGSNWYNIDVDGAYVEAQEAHTLAADAYTLASVVQGNLNLHVNNVNNPHQTTVAKLTDTEITSPSNGDLLRFNGTKWVNSSSDVHVEWGEIEGTITDQTDLQGALDAKVNIDGSSIMTAPLKFKAGSMRGAVGPYLNGVSFWEMDSQGTITNIANISVSRFAPVQNGTINLGDSTHKWKDLYVSDKAYVATINNGADITVPNVAGVLAVQVSALPTAGAGNVDKVYQYVGATDANYTNGYFYKCVSDGQEPATYSWEQCSVQPAPNGLPDQTGNAGKFLTTDGTDASWSDKPLVNNATHTGALSIAGTASKNARQTIIGYTAEATSSDTIVVGYNSKASNSAVALGAYTRANCVEGVAIGYSASVNTNGHYGIAIGGNASTEHLGAIQIGKGSNNTDSTLQVGLVYSQGGSVNNYRLLDANGTIPTDRFTTTPSADGTYVPTLTISSGVATRTWGAGGSSLPSQSGHSGEFLTTNGTDASWASPVVATFRVWGANE